MKYLIVNADDFGWSKDVVDSIIDGYKKKLFTSTSIMVTMPAYEYGLEKLKENPGLGVGVHLSLFDGTPVLPPEEVSTLIDPETGNFLSLEAARKVASKMDHRQIRKEFNAQMEKFMESGLTPTHVDNHCTLIYMKPKWFQIVLDIASKYNLPVRTPIGEGFQDLIPELSKASKIPPLMLRYFGYKVDRQIKKSKVSRPNYFIGHFTNVDETFGVEDRVQLLLNLLDNIEDGVTELMTHPSYSELWRQLEMNTWLDDRVITKIKKLNDVEMKNYEILNDKY